MNLPSWNLVVDATSFDILDFLGDERLALLSDELREQFGVTV